MLATAVKAFVSDQNGATVIEYGLIAGLLAAVIIASFAVLGDSLFNMMGAGTGGAAEVIANQID